MAGKFNETTGELVNLKLINPTDDVMMIADNGIIIRIRAEEISKISRNTKGVRIMRMKNEGNVVCVAVAPPEPDEQTIEEAERHNAEMAEEDAAKDAALEKSSEELLDGGETGGDDEI